MNKKLLLILLSSLSLFAETTMCYKENVTSLAGIENEKLDGGLCKGNLSFNEMKSSGWKVSDIKISTNDNKTNYTYIFKKDETEVSNFDIAKLEEKIVARLENKRIQDEKNEIEELKLKMSKEGRDRYIRKCQECHGEKAEIAAFGTSKPLIELSLEDMQMSINDYKRSAKDNGNGIIMTPHARALTSQQVKNIYSFILSLKNNEELK